MGRPATAPRKLKDGFYIEVCQKGARNGIKIWCPDEERMRRSASDYSRSKDVNILGEHINGKWVSEMKPKKLEREKAAQQKKAEVGGGQVVEKPVPQEKKAATERKVVTEKKVVVEKKIKVEKKPTNGKKVATAKKPAAAKKPAKKKKASAK